MTQPSDRPTTARPLRRARQPGRAQPVARRSTPRSRAQTGQAIATTALLCPLDGFAATVRAFAAGGGARLQRHRAVQVRRLRLAPRCSDRAPRWPAPPTRCASTPSGWLADNTDGVGLVRDIERNAGVPLAGRRVLLVGAGGAAAGVLGPLLAARPAALVVANRSADKAQALVARARRTGPRAHGVRAAAPARSTTPARRFDVVINASASSLPGAALPVSARVLAPGALALDLMYGPAAAALPATGRATPARRPATAWACWSSRRPRPSSSGAACGPTTAPVLAALRARRRWPRDDDAAAMPRAQAAALGLAGAAVRASRCSSYSRRASR